MSEGYAGFVWSAYAATALAVLILLLRAVLDHRSQLRALARLEPGARQDGRTAG